MLFNSIEFLVFFFPIVYIAYVLLNHKIQNKLLLVASYIFYGAWDYRFLSLLLISTIIDFFISHKIESSNSQKHKKQWLILSLCSNLGLLSFFKYFNFFIDSFIDLFNLFGISIEPWHLNIILPVGISFYTFQTMSYSIDVYQGKLKACRNFLDFALYVSFFPQLVAGPIERAEHLLPQVLNKRSITVEKLRKGLWLILLGYFQKVYVADNLAPFVNSTFATDHPSNGIVALLAIYAFAFQIYGDFAGYSNIARGIGSLMGFDMMLNFRSPYFAISPSDFWKRWHISLSSWLRDYLYIPLGGNRHGTLKTYRNLLITMLLGGLWHGASWTFVIWGGFHGGILIFERLIRSIKIPFFNINSWISKLPLILLMFHVTCLGWLIFRATSVNQIKGFLEAILFDFRYVPGVGIGNVILLAKVLIVLIIIDAFSWTKDDTDFVLKLPVLVRSFVFSLLILLVLIAGNFGYNEFIYFQF